MSKRLPPHMQRRIPQANSRVLHPHLVNETGQEVNHDAYESDGSIFSSVGDPRSPIPMSQHANLGAPQQAAGGGISDFVRQNPIIATLAAAAVGALIYKSLESSGEENEKNESFRKSKPSATPEVLVLPSQPVVTQPQQPTQVITPQFVPQPMMQSLQQPKVIDAQFVEIKKKRKKRRKKPDNVQVRNDKGQFTSKTKPRKK